jgi:hypothetical protein
MRKYREHVPFVLALVIVELLLPQLWHAWYRTVRRPALIRAGAVPCATYTPLLKEYLPADCDLALAEHRGAETKEKYFGRTGEAETEALTRDGAFVYGGTTYKLRIACFVLPLIAFIAMVVAGLHKMIRTDSLFAWQAGRFGADDFERTIYVYAIPVAVVGFGRFFLS